MSSRSAHGLSAICLLLLTSSLGCWEQWSVDWFPQMKWQKAVQPFERVAFEGRDAAFLPPEGSVPVHGYEPLIGRLDIAATDALVNPRDPADFKSVANGEKQYRIYCLPCHGADGPGRRPGEHDRRDHGSLRRRVPAGGHRSRCGATATSTT